MEANIENKEHQKIPLSEKLKGLPGLFGIHLYQKPAYEVLKKEGSVEIRSYKPMTLAQVTLNEKDFDAFAKNAFLTLADYIFGSNVDAEKIETTTPVLHAEQPKENAEQKSTTIPMTTPVLHEAVEQGWKMSFVLPEKYDKKKPPKPLDHSVQIVNRPQKLVVALLYHGNNTIQKMEFNKSELGQWLTKNPRLHPISDFYFAQYDGPDTISFLKKNEIMVDVQIQQ